MQQLPKQVLRPKTHRHEPAGRGSDHNDAPKDGSRLTFYPAYCFKASETYTKWVKLTARDIHSTLKPHSKYNEVTTDSGERGGLLLFYLNHPIQFVQVVGVVVVFEEYFEKFWLFTLDDSSGATLDVCCPKPEKKANEGGGKLGSHVNKAPRRSVGEQQATDSARTCDNEDPDVVAQRSLHATLARLDIGTVVQAKGIITTFRSVRQLELIRLSIIPTTSHELSLISSRSQFLASTLSKAWAVSPQKQKALLLEAQGEHEGKNERERKRRERRELLREREERHARRIRRQYEREEHERKKSSEQARVSAQQVQKERR
ncbi:uncharacterized protein A1O9_12288 [Exophiala aquamarina CBS 119918]|uniref:CST complex subunit Stn1 N-terminal domain-containing protein n=1 Tax=Exophiala aquamarina CBS 119918 TaxID=1182545 RepID=A0A072NX94_9EURO|nr:uncharacterized protein A1O9_12288 [Exophiala aquamarina CBS 119918]KEF51653.1 hypothetical protein A1O9_12288 [Exophiala aquamarina CBS 119918]